MSAARRTAPAPAFKLSTLFGLAKEIGMTPEDAKYMAYSLIGKDSLKAFTPEELGEVCQELIARKTRQQQRPGRITDQQLYRVREYERLLGWSEEPQRLTGFVEKYYHAASVLWLTPTQAGKLIESLKAMCAREQATSGR